jgi:hypothetical protein
MSCLSFSYYLLFIHYFFITFLLSHSLTLSNCWHLSRPVHPCLGGLLVFPVHGTDLELEVSPVVGVDVHLYVDGLAHGVPPDQAE